MLQERFFDVCVLDEATQAPEPAALVVAAQRVRRDGSVCTLSGMLVGACCK